MATEQVDQTVITQTPTTSGGQQTVQTDSSQTTRSGPGGSEMTRRIIIFGFGLVQLLLGARIVLLLLDAREANGLVSGILNVSQVFVAPFEGHPPDGQPARRRFAPRHHRDRGPHRDHDRGSDRALGRGHLPPRPGLSPTF